MFKTVLNTEQAAAITAGDNVAATAFGQLIVRTGNNAPNVITMPPFVSVATFADRDYGLASIPPLVCVGKISDWAYGLASVMLRVAAHATDP